MSKKGMSAAKAKKDPEVKELTDQEKAQLKVLGAIRKKLNGQVAEVYKQHTPYIKELLGKTKSSGHPRLVRATKSLQRMAARNERFIKAHDPSKAKQRDIERKQAKLKKMKEKMDELEKELANEQG